MLQVLACMLNECGVREQEAASIKVRPDSATRPTGPIPRGLGGTRHCVYYMTNMSNPQQQKHYVAASSYV